MRKRILTIMLSVVLALSALVSCSPSNVTKPSTDNGKTEENSEPIVLSSSAPTPYVIICGKNAGEVEKRAAETLKQAFQTYLGLNIPIKIDLILESAGYTESPYEIIVGITERKPAGAWDASALRYKDYFYQKCGTKLLIAGKTEQATENAVKLFIKDFLPKKCDSLTIRDSDSRMFEGKYSLTSFTANGTELKNFQLVADKSSAILTFSVSSFANRIETYYGYSATVTEPKQADGEKSQLRLSTVSEYPTLADKMQDAYAILTVKDGVPLLVAKDDITLADALKEFVRRLDTQKSLELQEGEVAMRFTPNDDLSVLSFNLAGETDYYVRRDGVLDILASYIPDTFGIQEGKSSWNNLLSERLNDLYTCVGEGNAEDNYTETFNNIYFRNDKYNLIEGDTIWLSNDIHEAGSKFDESKRVRTATYALLECKSTGKKILYVNTHLDNNSAKAREMQLQILLRFIDSYEVPCVLTGDFNTGMSTNVYKTVTMVMDDSRTESADIQLAPTYNGYGKSVNILDYCFFTTGCFELLYYRVHTELYQGNVYQSDHNAIYTEYRLK